MPYGHLTVEIIWVKVLLNNKPTIVEAFRSYIDAGMNLFAKPTYLMPFGSQW